MKAIAMVAGVVLAAGVAVPAMAAAPSDNAMKVCGARYQADKLAKKLPAGQTWNAYLASCRAGLAKNTAINATATGAKATPAQVAMRARQQQCAKQYQADKAAHKLAAGQTWPKYWSQCNTKLKG